MKTPALATIYLDNEAVGLMGDPCPSVSKVVTVSGKRPESVQVLRGISATDLRGTPVQPEDTLDRTVDPTTPIYLTCRARPKITGVPMELPDQVLQTPSIPPLPKDDGLPGSPVAPLPGKLGSPSKDRAAPREVPEEADWHIPPSKGDAKAR